MKVHIGTHEAGNKKKREGKRVRSGEEERKEAWIYVSTKPDMFAS